MSLGSASTADAGSGRNLLADVFYPLYVRLFDENSDFVANMESKLAEARIPQTVEIYLSRALAVGVIVGAALWLVGTDRKSVV